MSTTRRSPIFLLGLLLLSPPVLGETDVQSDWSGGGGLAGPVDDWGDRFMTSTDVDYDGTSGELSLAVDPPEHILADGQGQPCGLYVVDFDDDDDDLIVGSQTSGVAWYENPGTLVNWTVHAIDAAFGSCFSPFAGDIDDDGDPDILASSFGLPGGVAWWENDGSWTRHNIESTRAGILNAAAMDIDDDGDLDAAYTNINTGEVRWAENPGGSGVWTSRVLADDLPGAWHVVELDLDGDGLANPCAAASLGDRVAWYEKDGFAAQGTLTSSFLSTDGAADWEALSWDVQAPTGATVTVEVRSGDAMTAMSPWEPVGASGDDASAYAPDGRELFQYRLTLGTTDPLITPVFEEPSLTRQVSSAIGKPRLEGLGLEEGALLRWEIVGDAPAALRLLRGDDAPIVIADNLVGLTSFLDRDAVPGASHTYHLEAFDAAGRTVTSAPVTITLPVGSVEGLSLAAPYPNTARDCVVLETVLPAESGPVELAVYDLGGRLIKSRRLTGTAGRQRIVLATGGYAAGVYLARLEGAAASARRRFVIAF